MGGSWSGIGIGGERADSAVVWVNESLHVGCEVLSGEWAVLEIADVMRELAERFTIVECAFDPWRAGQIGQELEQRGIRVSTFPAPRREDGPSGRPACAAAC